MGSRFGASQPVYRDASTAPWEGATGRGDRREDADPLDTIRKQTIDQVLSELGSSRGGIASEEAGSRQQTAGKNLIESAKKRSPLLAFLSNFTHLMAVLLWVAGSIAFLAGMPELGVAVWLVNIINGVFSFWQEHRASQATEALKKMLPAYATVIRDGQEQKILAEDLVPGDVMLLAEGDKISADARVIQSSDLQVNQSTLNGESTPSRKTADAVLEEGLSAAEIPNLVFAGTSVSEGNGRAVVFRIGMATEFGKIASLTQNMEAAESPLTRELNRLTKQVTVFAMCMGIAFFLLSMLVVKEPFASSFIFALGMVVAFIPEGLLPTVTLSLAMAVQRMSTRNALVKKLDSVEALGSTSVICTDKTGTLTQNEMTVNHLWTATREYEISGVGYEPQGTIEAEGRNWRAVDDADLELLLEGGLLCGNARLAAPETEGGRWEVYGDPTEACLIVSAAKGGIDRTELEKRMPRIKELPFESRRKRMTTVHALEHPVDGARRLAFVKGAPNEVVRLATKVRRNGKTVELDDTTRERIMAANDTYAADGLRVLAVAYRPLDGIDADADIPASLSDYDPDTIERNLTFVGLEVMMDPPRPEVAAAVAECRRAGIRIVMITGDYGLTAASIARRLKIVEGDDVSVISGFELAHMDDEELKRRLAGQVVFARMAPEQKLRVVTALQEMGEIVAVTGDGVNDAPALKKADIGVAMGITGTDVAKEAADMILTDDNFASIVAAIEEGRAVYSNIRKFLLYILNSNAPEAVPSAVYLLSGGAVPLPLTTMQILTIDLGTDMLPALGLGTEPPEDAIMDQPPRDPHERLLNRHVLVKAFLWYGLMASIAAMAGYLVVNLLNGWVPGMPLFGVGDDTDPVYIQATTMTLAGIVFAQIGQVMNCRTERTSVLKIGLFSNRRILVGIVFEVALIVFLTMFPPLQAVFHTAPLGWQDYAFLCFIPPVVFVIEEARKAWLRRRARR
ncbi:cation-translocating P-type ATPase [Collinsella intestinalis]|uniref:cation-translocating P-type ATPase n=1 Tax=Collinsella intestinalis TaxID=147207 RepID=UPI0019567F03|nr:cation-transporting P-type ATPase [Collinsella intestinalis]MBM6907509.1 cation-transporting P-type ATPase [Collinsella intestinalis]